MVKDEYGVIKDEHDVIKDEHGVIKDEHDVIKDEQDVVKDEHDVVKDEKKLVIQNKDVRGDVSWENWNIDDMDITEQEILRNKRYYGTRDITEQETRVLQNMDNTTCRAPFKIQTVGKVIYISNCKIDNFSC